jgi:histidine triad (HIT) family protein
MSCLFCKIASGQIPSKTILDEPDVFAFHDIQPVAPVHALVIPKKHLVSLADATGDDAALLGKVMDAARRVAETLGLREGGFRVVLNTGADGGQSVFHLHAHVLGGRSLSWPPG